MIMNNPRSSLTCLINDDSIRSFLRESARSLLTEITRLDASIASVTRLGGIDTTADYERMHRLELDAWHLVERVQ